MDPKGPSQPPLDTAYSTSDNPTDTNPQEQAAASSKTMANVGSIVDQRKRGDIPVPSKHNREPMASSLGYGGHGEGDVKDEEPIDPDRNPNNEGEQMRAPGEGDVYNAQFNKTGFGEQGDLASGLDAKKKEQAAAREQVKAARAAGANIGDTGPAGGRGGVET